MVHADGGENMVQKILNKLYQMLCQGTFLTEVMGTGKGKKGIEIDMIVSRCGSY
jgi:hypothetical protein